ncbi:MAG: TldD/PmbA family protein [Bacteroidales bacterium]|nr:TldD/PmbA family protein [Bacteroidales bacterium]
MKNIREIFGVSDAQLQSLVAEGLRTGGGWCDLYFEHTAYLDLLLRDSQVGSAGYHIDYGCGIRVLSGEKTGYAYAESTDYSSLLAAAKAAASIAGGASPAQPAQAIPTRQLAGTPGCYRMDQDWMSVEIAGLTPYLERLESEIRRRDSRVVKVVAMLSASVSDIMMYNSLGELSTDSRPLGSISIQLVAAQGEKIESRSVSRSFRTGAEFLTEELLQELAAEAVAGMDESFEASRPKGGRMPVVMAAGASGILLHEAMGHAFEADFNRKGQSIFSDRMGERICRKGINIVDDGTIAGNRGSVSIDDEGVPGQKTYMVADGVLNSYLHDRISAGYYGVAPTGNGRRESFRYNPIPRMRATYMESGSDGTLDDLIGSVKKGIYVDRFSNGQVKIGEGDFTFYVKSGFLIENGRLTQPVKDLNIIGNGPKALADIRAVAGDLKVDNGTWTCGKEQSVAVSCGIPSVLIGKLTVGGE